MRPKPTITVASADHSPSSVIGSDIQDKLPDIINITRGVSSLTDCAPNADMSIPSSESLTNGPTAAFESNSVPKGSGNTFGQQETFWYSASNKSGW